MSEPTADNVTLEVCGHCQMPSMAIGPFRQHMEKIEAIRARMEADHQRLRELQAAGQLTLQALWLQHDEWLSLRMTLDKSASDISKALYNLETQYTTKLNAVKHGSGHDRPGSSGGSAHYEERKASYEIKVQGEWLWKRAAEQLHAEMESLSWGLKHLIDNWDARRVDLKWENDRISGPKAPQRV